LSNYFCIDFHGAHRTRAVREFEWIVGKVNGGRKMDTEQEEMEMGREVLIEYFAP
jgi:hypothetical protein